MAMPEHIEQSHQGCTKLRCSYFYKTLFALGGGGGLNVDNFHIFENDIKSMVLKDQMMRVWTWSKEREDIVYLELDTGNWELVLPFVIIY